MVYHVACLSGNSGTQNTTEAQSIRATYAGINIPFLSSFFETHAADNSPFFTC